MKWTLFLTIAIVCCKPGVALCGDDWTMERVGRKDLGVNWNSPLHVAPDKWMIATDNGVIVVVTDSGRTFTPLDVGICSDLVCLAKVGDAIIVAAANGTLLYTTDEGVNIKSLGVIAGGIKAMQALDAAEFAVCTNTGSVRIVNWKTGTNQEVYNDVAKSFTCMDVHNGELSVIGYAGTIIHTTDRGVTWTTTQHADTVVFTSCCRVDDSTLVLGASYARVYVTENNGRTIVNAYQAKSYFKMDNRNLEAVTNITHWGGAIFFTGEFFPRDPEEFFNVYKSTDRGKSWTGFPFPTDEPVPGWTPVCLYWDEAGIGRLVLNYSTAGTVVPCSSTDMGEHWQSDTALLAFGSEIVNQDGIRTVATRDYFATATIFQKLFVLGKVTYASAFSNAYISLKKLYESSNGGQDFTPLVTLKPNVNSIASYDSILVLGCDSGSVLISHDLGRTFSDRIVVDSATIYNGVSVCGHTGEGRFVTFTTIRKDNRTHEGWISTVDSKGVVQPMPLPRTFDYDRLTAPYVSGDTVFAIYHEIDSSLLVVTASYIVTWDTKTDNVVLEDITDMLRDWVEFNAAIKYASEEKLWIATSTQVFVYDRATKQSQAIPELATKKTVISSKSAGGWSVSDEGNMIYMNGTLFATNTSPTGWQRISPCGAVNGKVTEARSATSLGNGRYFVVTPKANYILTAPTVASVAKHEWQPAGAPSTFVVKIGDPVFLDLVEHPSLYCHDVMGRRIPVHATPTEGGALVTTAAWSPGMYVFVSESSHTLTTRTVLLVP